LKIETRAFRISKIGFPMKILQTAIALLVIQMAFSSPARANTSIVVVRTPRAVYVGADSKTIIEGQPVTDRKVCKIYQADELIFAVAGFAGDRRRGFNIPEIVARAGKNASSLREWVRRSEEALAEHLTGELVRLKREAPATYEKVVKGEGAPVLTLAFAGYEEEATFVIISQFATREDNPLAVFVKRDSCPGDCPFGVKTFFLGSSKAIARYITGKSGEGNMEPIEAIRYLIGLEIEENPQKVGGPVDILQIDRQGPKWIQKKGECPELR
jgi:hypothetical protein